MQAARGRVGAAAELATRVQLREHDLDARETRARFDVDGDATGAVAHLDAAVGVQDHLDARPVAAERLVDGVVDDLPHAVHEAARIGGADVHARALADGLEPFEHLEVMGGILSGHNLQAYAGHPTPRRRTRDRHPTGVFPGAGTVRAQRNVTGSRHGPSHHVVVCHDTAPPTCLEEEPK